MPSKYRNNQPNPLGFRDQPVTILAWHVVLVPPYALFCYKSKILGKMSFCSMISQFWLKKSWYSSRKSCRGVVPPWPSGLAEMKEMTSGVMLPSVVQGRLITTGRLSTATAACPSVWVMGACCRQRQRLTGSGAAWLLPCRCWRVLVSLQPVKISSSRMTLGMTEASCFS